MGLKLMPLPEEPFINFAGMLSEQERLQALEAATVVVCPSPYESLSLIALEALAVGTPILCNARSEVLVDHCLRSNGGLFYRDRDGVRRMPEAARIRRAAPCGDGAIGPRVRPAELPVGCRARKTGQDDRETR
jgi:glycosyltransferase involved in cell wall biosynthesis